MSGADLFDSQVVFGGSLGRDSIEGHVVSRGYEIVSSLPALTAGLDRQLSRLREARTIDGALVLHKDALLHILRIVRVLHHTDFPILLLGPNGCGKRTLARLSAALARYAFKSGLCSENSTFREAIKGIIAEICAGNEKKFVVLVSEDELLENTGVAADVACWATGGTIPGLLNKEELEAALTLWRASSSHEAPLSASSRALTNRLWLKVRHELRLILTLSMRDSSLKLMRTHPGLVEACAVNFVSPWSHSTLVEVSTFVLQHKLHGLSVSEEIYDVSKLAAAGVDMHSHVCSPNTQYTPVEGMCSPASRFFDFQSHFLSIFESKYKELGFNLDKLRSGIRKMEETELYLQTMHSELEALKPQLEVKAIHALRLEEKLRVC